MNQLPVRVRFAPSPTGPLHIGGVRTALYNYLFARNNRGRFVLRIEDTDRERYVEGAEDYLFEALDWSGISPDEGPHKGGDFGPYRQSERKHIYGKYAEELVEKGLAYYAFDTSEELEQVREMAKRSGSANWQYNHVTRSSMKNSLTLPADEVRKRLERGDPHVIRIKLERNEEVKFEDRIRGWVSVNTNHMDDKVLFKGDGMPTYHLANVVDDHLMEITHVIRGEEWLPSAPLHVLLYRYLGWEDRRPEFSHLPLLLKPDGNGKLSKRDGDRLGFPVFPLAWKNPETGEVLSGYREDGYFPEAFINILAFLGWNPGTDQEIFSMEELIRDFSLDRVGKAGAKFDHEKAHWFNQQYLRAHSNEELSELLKPVLDDAGVNYDADKLPAICNLMKERATFVNDMFEEGRFFFEAPGEYDEKTMKKKWKKDSPQLLGDLKDTLSSASFTSDELEERFQAFLKEREVGFGKVGPVFRLALTGKGMGPSMFDICEILGKEEVLKRIDTALEKLG